MRTDGVVIFQPMFGDLANLLKIIKQVSIQDIFPVGAVQALDVSVLRRLAGLDVEQFYMLFFGQLSSRCEINPGPSSIRILSCLPRCQATLQNSHYPFCW